MNQGSLLSPTQTATALLAAMEEGDKAAVLVVISHPEPEEVGGRLFFRGGRLHGSLGDSRVDSAAAELAATGLSGAPTVLPGLHTLTSGDGQDITVYLELHHPPLEMVIVGAGHLAQPLCTLGSLLGMAVRVMDDRPDFATPERFPEAAEICRVDFTDPFAKAPLHPWSHVLLVTRGHRYDFECLRRVLQHDPLPGYIGMIGSRRRVRATLSALLEEGFSRDLLSQVRAPIGLDIGGETPAEIAVSVGAEIVQLWRGGSGRPLKEHEDVLERLLPDGGGNAHDSTNGGGDA
jgi:xanthine dehydrogenase accessory factor